jgi:hypothetical protein
MRGIDDLVIAKMDLTTNKVEDLPQNVQDELSKHSQLPTFLLFSQKDAAITPFGYLPGGRGHTSGKRHKEFLPDMVKFLNKRLGVEDAVWMDMLKVHSQERSWEIFIHEHWPQKQLCPSQSSYEPCRSTLLYEKDFPGAVTTLDVKWKVTNRLQPAKDIDIIWCAVNGTRIPIQRLPPGKTWEYETRRGMAFLIFSADEPAHFITGQSFSTASRHRGWETGAAAELSVQSCIGEQDHFDPRPTGAHSAAKADKEAMTAAAVAAAAAAVKSDAPASVPAARRLKHRKKIKFKSHAK